MSREFNKLLLKYEYLLLELQDIEDQIESAKPQWIKEFGEHFVKRGPVVHADSSDISASNIPPSIKKIYKKLSFRLHPDKGGDPEEFKKLKKYYDTMDIFQLYKLCKTYDVPINTSEIDISLLHDTCKSLEETIFLKKSTAVWLYYYGTEDQKKKAIRELEKVYKIQLSK